MGGLVPAVAGEIAAGAIVGRTGFGWLNPTTPTLIFLSQVGFAMLMFNAGMRVPLSEGGLGQSVGRGGLAAAIAAVLAVLAGLAVSLLPGAGHPALYAVLIASSSAAVALPVIQERRLSGPNVLTLIAQVTVADIAATVAIPFVLRPAAAGHAALGTLLTGLGVIAAYLASRALHDRRWVRSWRKMGKTRHWAIDLRVALIALFALGWLAQRTGASVLIAGFGAGLMVAAIGGPKRLSTEVLGIAGGFFVPLFFVVLGAQIQLRGIVRDPEMILLTCLLVVATVSVHVFAARLTGQRTAAGLISSAQLGVPSAIVALGLAEHILTPTQSAAIMTAAIATIVICGIGAKKMAAKAPGRDDPAPPPVSQRSA